MVFLLVKKLIGETKIVVGTGRRAISAEERRFEIISN